MAQLSAGRSQNGPMTTVALLTDLASVGYDVDHPALRAALEARGVEVVLAAWDDPARPLESWSPPADLVVVRSPWNYHEDAPAYLDGLRRIAARAPVLNDPDTVAWNVDKRYLAELADAGIAVTATAYVAPGEDPAIPLAAISGDLVVKPTVSAGSRNTARYSRYERDAARAHIDALGASGRTAMVQPYLAAVDATGETAMVYLDGRFSHAFRKGALLRPGAAPTEGLYLEESVSPDDASTAQRALGDAVLREVTRRFGPPLYARIDVLADEHGEPVLLEAELNEPSLFHAQAPGSAERFADAIVGHL